MPQKKIIRNVSELPEWYDLEKYQNALSLDAASWYELISQRLQHFFWLDYNDGKKYKKAYPDALHMQFSNVPKSMIFRGFFCL